MNSKTLILAAAGLSLAFGGVSASAQDLAQPHARQAEVDARLDKENARVDARQADGSITPAKAARLHRAVHRVRMAERRKVERHGRLTRLAQAKLDHRENRISHRIG